MFKHFKSVGTVSYFDQIYSQKNKYKVVRMGWLLRKKLVTDPYKLNLPVSVYEKGW